MNSQPACTILSRLKYKIYFQQIKYELLFCALWTGLAFLINPAGDFPLNDDWAYGKSVKYFSETGAIHLPDWCSTSFIAHLFWGSIFCFPAGFSFTALRISTLVMGLAGTLFVLKLFFLFTGHRQKHYAFLCTALITFNPLYFHLSYTFMTDIPFFTVQITAVYFFIRVLQKNNTKDLCIAISTEIIAVLIRHIALIVPLAFLIPYLLRFSFSLKNTMRAFFPLFIVGSVYIVFLCLLYFSQAVPAEFNNINNMFFNTIREGGLVVISKITYNVFYAFSYLGLFSFPLLTVFFIRYLKQKNKTVFFMLFLCCVVLMMYKLLKNDNLFPFLGNTLRSFGTGPPTLRDTDILHLPHLVSLPKYIWVFITLLSVTGSFMLLVFLLFIVSKIIKQAGTAKMNVIRTNQNAYKQEEKTSDSLFFVSLFLFLVFSFYLLIISISGYYDRYLLLLLPVFFLLLYIQVAYSQIPLLSKILFFIFIPSFTYFSVYATHDYLAWNRARWEAANYLVKEKSISPSLIDGGFEFNGWYNYDKNYRQKTGKSWWWVENDEYVISFGEISGYSVIKKYEYQQWMPEGEKYIFILKSSAVQ